MLNLYFHIPFCLGSCSYCNFVKLTSCSLENQLKYFKALEKEIKKSKLITTKNSIRTIYFGGGTPSLVSSYIIKDFLEFINKNFTLSPKTEITLEANPNTITKEKIKDWAASGINRLSIGIQTMEKKFQSFLSRDIFKLKKIKSIIKSWPYSINLDFIFGFPGQLETDLKNDLDSIIKLNPDHISYYALDYKKDSAIENNKDTQLEFSTICNYYSIICETLNKNGYNQYEIYNFSKQKKECIHNIDFWENKDYIGFGLGAVSCFNDQIQENTKNINEYFLGKTINKSYKLTKKERIERFLIRNLRLTKGLNKKELVKYFEKKISDKIITKAKTISSCIQIDDKKIKLTEEGMMNFSETIEYLIH